MYAIDIINAINIINLINIIFIDYNICIYIICYIESIEYILYLNPNQQFQLAMYLSQQHTAHRTIVVFTHVCFDAFYFERYTTWTYL